MFLCFSHIEKTGGRTMEGILRRSFGARHADVQPFFRHDAVFGPGDLQYLLRLNSNICSIAGHSVRPSTPLERVRDDVRFVLFVRDPLTRLRSHYQWQIENRRHRLSFERWLRDRNNHNWMTKFVCGQPDVDAAWDIIRERVFFTGLVERFDESLLMMRKFLGPSLPLNITYGQPVNVSGDSPLRQELNRKVDQYRSELLKMNSLDIELYIRVIRFAYPEFVRKYGPSLEADTLEFSDQNRRHAKLPSARFNAFKVLVHKPRLLVSRWVRRASLNHPDWERSIESQSNETGGKGVKSREIRDRTHKVR